LVKTKHEIALNKINFTVPLTILQHAIEGRFLSRL